MSPNIKIRFGTKAETLESLSNISLGCSIPSFRYITHAQWMESRSSVLENMKLSFLHGLLAVRSSAACEDGPAQSHAGAFESYLNINPQKEDELEQTIDRVFRSYPDQVGDNQVLIQRMVENVAVSGVVLTRCVDDGSPYYVLGYDDETGSSDSVTGGRGIHKTVMVYRGFKPQYCDSARVRQMLELAQKVESQCGNIPLDIEFAIDQEGMVHLLQVRRISTVSGWHPDIEHRVHRIVPHIEYFVKMSSARRNGLHGTYSILGNMPDWNPAEIIGVIPMPMAASLYRHVITSHAWSLARMEMGYRRMPRTELMVLIGGRPYIDVRASFNSFLPDELPEPIGDKLVNAWLDYLADHPVLHDKVEFDVAFTALDFSFDQTFAERYDEVLDVDERNVFKESLRVLTNKALDESSKGSLSLACRRIKLLAMRQQTMALSMETTSPMALAAFIAGLLDDCIQDGTIPFSIIARHAFVAETMLRSAVSRGALDSERLSLFKSSFNTIMGELARDTFAVYEGRMLEDQFYERYGHLRPGTYDILSSCYRNRTDLFVNCHMSESRWTPSTFLLTSQEEVAINRLLTETGIESVDAKGLFAYAQRSIQGREYAKFIFTRHLSAALEAIAVWGELYHMGREDLAHLRIEDILDTHYASIRGEVTSVLMEKVDRARMEQSYAKTLRLSHLIRGVKDIHVVPVHRTEPNFITQKRIEATCELLQPTSLDYGNLAGKIVCIENADPGFDWIFSKGIAGLITQFGGANSHMAIRCAELQLPAAIGCGEHLFERLTQWRKIDLDCSAKTIRSVEAYG